MRRYKGIYRMPSERTGATERRFNPMGNGILYRVSRKGFILRFFRFQYIFYFTFSGGYSLILKSNIDL
jgi:hypothetical protein